MKNVFVLPTDKPSRLYLSDYGKELNLSGYPLRNYTTGQHIYITSDEEIKEGDYMLLKYEHSHGRIRKCHYIYEEQLMIDAKKDIGFGFCKRNEVCKIILTTDLDLIKDGVQVIDDEFLEWFVENPSCEEVDYCNWNEYYKITPKEETKLKNICIKCGVDLYATEGKFECQKHPKECKGIYLSKETLLIHAAEQKQHLIDMMKADEELGLYEEPKQHIEFINANIEEFDKAIELFKEETLEQETTIEEAAENYANQITENDEFYKLYEAFKDGAKWQQDRICDSEVIQRIRASKSDAEARRIIRTI